MNTLDQRPPSSSHDVPLEVPGGEPFDVAPGGDPPRAEVDPDSAASPEAVASDQAASEPSLESIVNAGVERVLAAFETKLAYDAAKQVQIDRLHDEVMQHRRDLVARTAHPLIHGLIRIHDDIGKLMTALRAKPQDELTPARFFSLLEGFQEDVEIVLEHNGVKAYRMPAGRFEPRRQRILKKVDTADEALVGMIAESIRPGFEQGETLLEKERVSAYVLTLPSNTDTTEAGRPPRDSDGPSLG